jgi:hypothetical protein
VKPNTVLKQGVTVTNITFSLKNKDLAGKSIEVVQEGDGPAIKGFLIIDEAGSRTVYFASSNSEEQFEFPSIVLPADLEDTCNKQLDLSKIVKGDSNQEGNTQECSPLPQGDGQKIKIEISATPSSHEGPEPPGSKRVITNAFIVL